VYKYFIFNFITINMKLQDDLIYIKDNKAIPSPYAKTIIEFKNLKAEELGFVYFMCDHRSPFAVYDWEQRIEEVKNSIFGNKKWTPSDKVLIACEKYEKLIETSAVRLLKAAKESVVKLEKYFRTVDLTLMDDNGKPIYHAKDLINNLEKMGKVVDGLTRLEEIVKKEEQAANTNRGGIEVNKYSM
tara:strand:- start:923 stop:1480 length:558 start_codon:yes stop_codon:yes gene_type:complete